MILKDYIFCEDIREEQNNRLSLMGICNDFINIKLLNGEVPSVFPMRLATFLRVEFDEKDERPDNFNFKLYINNKSLADISGSLPIDREKRSVNLSIKGEGLPIESGEISFTFSLKAGNKDLFKQEVKSALQIKIEKENLVTE